MSTGNGTATNTEVATYVEYLHPGAFVSERSTVVVSSRDPVKAAAEAPQSAFAFRFFDTVSAVAEVEGQRVRLGSHELRPSGTYYIDAEKFTASDLAASPRDYSVLLSNMESNGWPAVVKCRTGNFQPLLDGDEIVTVEAGAQ